MSLALLKEALRPLTQRIMLLCGRCVIRAVRTDGALSGLVAELLQGEIHDGLSLFQQFGFESIPLPGGEGIAVFPGGNRSLGFVVATADRMRRPKDLAAGETAVYSGRDSGEDGSHRVHLKSDRTTEAACQSWVFNLDGTLLTITAAEGMVSITAPGIIQINDTVMPAAGGGGSGRPALQQLDADTVEINADALRITLGGKAFTFTSSGMPARIGTDTAGGDEIEEGS